MSKILGPHPGELARVLSIEGGRINVGELRDGEGISLVYDVGKLVSGQQLLYGTRQVEAVTFDDTGTQFYENAGLPAAARIIGVYATVNNEASVEHLTLQVKEFGGPGAPSDHLLFFWETGGSVITRPDGFNVTATPQNRWLLSSYGAGNIPFTFIDQASQVRRQGNRALRWQGEAVPAGSFTLSAIVLLAFWLPDTSGPGAGNNSLAMEVPSW